MPSTPSRSSMSPGELVTCEDFLDGHREYALDLLSNIEKMYQWHGSDRCQANHEGRICALCELCSANGLMGATKKALASYEDAENHLKCVRMSLGKCAPGRGAPRRETLFRSNLAKAVFLCVAAVGDNLRLQHATWQARLQSEVAALSEAPSDPSPQHASTDPGDLRQNMSEDGLLPAYSGPMFVDPEADLELAAVSTGMVPKMTSNSSVFVVFRRCLSSNCPCEANEANAASDTVLRGNCGSQATSQGPFSSLQSKKVCEPRVIQSTTTDPCPSTNVTPDALVQARANTKTRVQTVQGPDVRAFDIQVLQGPMLREHESSSSVSNTNCSRQEAGSSTLSPGSKALVADPGAQYLRAQVVRANDARRALMEWCRACRTDLQLVPRTGATYESTTGSSHTHPPPLTPGLGTAQPGESLCMMPQLGNGFMDGLSYRDETMPQEAQLDSKQELLRERWLMARQKRGSDRKRRCIKLPLTNHRGAVS